MMKWRQIIIAVLLLIIILVIGCYLNKEVTIIKDIDIANIDKIELFQNDTSEVLYSRKSISEIMDILASVTLRKSYNGTKDGGFRVNIYFGDGKSMTLIILSKDIYIDGETYKCDIDCVDKLRKIYARESDKKSISEMDEMECYQNLLDCGLVIPKKCFDGASEEEIAENVKFHADYALKNNGEYPAYGGLPLSVFAGRVAVATIKYEMSEDSKMADLSIERLQPQEKIYLETYGID